MFARDGCGWWLKWCSKKIKHVAADHDWSSVRSRLIRVVAEVVFKEDQTCGCR